MERNKFEILKYENNNNNRNEICVCFGTKIGTI